MSIRRNDLPSFAEAMAAKAALERGYVAFNLAEEAFLKEEAASDLRLEHLISLVLVACKPPIRTLADAMRKAAFAGATDTDEHVDVVGELADLQPKLWSIELMKICQRARSARSSGNTEAEKAILTELRAGAGPEFQPLRSAH